MRPLAGSNSKERLSRDIFVAIADVGAAAVTLGGKPRR